MFSGNRRRLRNLSENRKPLKTLRNIDDQCKQLQVEFNRDLRLIPTRAMTRTTFCTKWANKLKNTNCDSLKRQLRSFC